MGQLIPDTLTTSELKHTIETAAHELACYHGVTVRIQYEVKPSPFDLIVTPLEVGS